MGPRPGAGSHRHGRCLHPTDEYRLAGHPLADGNKRLGWVATRLFYLLNGFDIRARPDDAYEVVVAVAGGEPRDVGVIAERLAAWRRPIG